MALKPEVLTVCCDRLLARYAELGGELSLKEAKRVSHAATKCFKLTAPKVRGRPSWSNSVLISLDFSGRPPL